MSASVTNAVLWTIRVQRVSPITGRIGWHQLLRGARKQPPTWPTRDGAVRFAASRYGFNAGRSKVVAVGGAP